MSPSPMQALFAGELRRARDAKGLTQQALGDAIQYSGSMVALVEQGRRVPGRDFTRRCDEALPTDGLLERIRTKIKEESLLPWFREWAGFEQEAVGLRNYENNFVPGLLQAEEYARALHLGGSPLSAEEIDEQVAARMERQAVLTRERPPQFVAVMDDHVLRRPIGGPKVMHGQLVRLVEMGELPHVSLHVIPSDVGMHAGLDGAFAIATLPDGEDVAYLDHQLKGHVIQCPTEVLALRQRWEAVRAEALPHRQTMEVIMEAAKSWI